MRVIKVFLCIGLACVLSGCFEMEQEIQVTKDGGGRLLFTVGLGEQLVSMAKQQGGDKTGPEADLKKAADELAKDERITDASFKQTNDSGMHYYQIDAGLVDITQADEILKEMMQDEGQQAPAGNDMSITKLDSGNLQFRQTIKSEGASQEQNVMGQMMAQQLAGKYYTIRVQGDIVSHNGTMLEDGKTVEWKLSLAELVSGAAVDRTLEAEFNMKTGFLGTGIPTPIFFGIVAGVVLLLALLTVVLRRKKA